VKPVKINLDKERTLNFHMGCIEAIQEKFDLDMPDIQKMLLGMQKRQRIKDIKILLWAMLCDEPDFAELTPDLVIRMIPADKMADFVRAMTAMMANSMPEPTGDPLPESRQS